ncbi:uncharacterized protein LOC121015008 [Herpailurus yagouaroundi]|uniref:uncharacterized protein LOC121015008 n=1 Tax=Herpailurus yagouaroundi TaxID=1608482 RepID=UPI001AD7413B|nr:uncharacterized protein LOC121015008 [Puma yagouaroundi]
MRGDRVREGHQGRGGLIRESASQKSGSEVRVSSRPRVPVSLSPRSQKLLEPATSGVLWGPHHFCVFLEGAWEQVHGLGEAAAPTPTPALAPPGEGELPGRPALPLPCDGCTRRTETGSGWRPQGGRHPCRRRRFTWEPRGPCPTASSGGFEGQDLENVDTGLEQKGLARSWSFCDFCALTGPQPLCRRGPGRVLQVPNKQRKSFQPLRFRFRVLPTTRFWKVPERCRWQCGPPPSAVHWRLLLLCPPRPAWTGNRSLRERNGSRSVPATGAEPVEALGDVTRDSSHLARGPPEPQHLKTTPVSPTESQTHHEALPSPWPDQARSFPRGRGWPCDLGDPRSEYDEPARAPRPPLSARGLRRTL